MRHDEELLQELLAVSDFDCLVMFDAADLLPLCQGSFDVTLLCLFCADVTVCCTRPLVRSTRGVPGEYQGSTRAVGGICSSLARCSSALPGSSVPKTTEKKTITEDSDNLSAPFANLT